MKLPRTVSGLRPLPCESPCEALCAPAIGPPSGLSGAEVIWFVLARANQPIPQLAVLSAALHALCGENILPTANTTFNRTLANPAGSAPALRARVLRPKAWLESFARVPRRAQTSRDRKSVV